MNFKVVLFLAMFIFGLVASALGIPIVSPLELDALKVAEAGAEDLPGIRQKRATCDLLSIFNVNHTACAIHCIGLNRGFRGGFCNGSQVCVCRH